MRSLLSFIKQKERHIANALTSSRMLFSPLLIYAGATDNKKLFLVFFTSNSILDALDGFLARILKIESDLGRRLDTFVDNVVIITGILLFFFISRSEIVNYFDKYAFLALIPAVTYIIQIFLGFLYKKKLSSFHFYSAKFAQIPLVLFFIFSLLYEFQALLLTLAVISFVISNIEGIIVYLVRKGETDENIKSVFELL